MAENRMIRRSKHVLKTPWPEVILSKPLRLRTGYAICIPYCVAFVYSKKGNIVVKGYAQEVGDAINKRRWGNCVYYYTYWYHGCCRGEWSATPGIFVKKKRIGKRKKFLITVCTYHGDIVKVFRRMPKRWLQIYDYAVGTGLIATDTGLIATDTRGQIQEVDL